MFGEFWTIFEKLKNQQKTKGMLHQGLNFSNYKSVVSKLCRIRPRLQGTG